jgi:hypothetical protein
MQRKHLEAMLAMTEDGQEVRFGRTIVVMWKDGHRREWKVSPHGRKDLDRDCYMLNAPEIRDALGVES